MPPSPPPGRHRIRQDARFRDPDHREDPQETRAAQEGRDWRAHHLPDKVSRPTPRRALCRTSSPDSATSSLRRELATQIHSIFQMFTHESLAPPLLLISSSESTPAQDLARFLDTEASIVVATPGRVDEFLLGRGKGIVRVKEMEVLVLDEADRSVCSPTQWSPGALTRADCPFSS